MAPNALNVLMFSPAKVQKGACMLAQAARLNLSPVGAADPLVISSSKMDEGRVGRLLFDLSMPRSDCFDSDPFARVVARHLVVHGGVSIEL